MNELLRLAYERRERLRAELSAIENLIADHERLESKTRRAATPNYELPLDEAGRGRRRRSAATEIAPVLDAAEAAILAAGRPMSRSELVSTLEGQGFAFLGGDKVKVFGTNLWRSKRFVSLKGIGYWPEAYPLPAAYQSVDQRESMLKRSK